MKLKGFILLASLVSGLSSQAFSFEKVACSKIISSTPLKILDISFQKKEGMGYTVTRHSQEVGRFLLSSHEETISVDLGNCYSSESQGMLHINCHEFTGHADLYNDGDRK